MGFSTKQLQALRRNPDARYIRTREAHGRELSYLEGWYAISEANRIFGFEGWSRETVEARCVLSRETKGTFVAVYSAKVRVTVQADGLAVIREGHGTGESRANTPGEVHDTALKAAETDATKRALATFGRPFGLELYKTARSPKDVGVASVPGVATKPGYDPPAESGSFQSTERQRETVKAGPRPLETFPRAESAKVAGERSEAPNVSAEAPALGAALHYDRRRYHDTRVRNGTLVREAEQKAVEAQLVPSGPELLTSTKIDKSVLAFGEPKRIRDKAHLRFVGSQPCLICGRLPADAHHLRFAQPRALGRKVSDEFTVPLCRGHHREVHQTGNEPAWWEDLDIDALEIAKGLWEQSHMVASTPTVPDHTPP